jgi:hypothetical protein
MNETNDPLEAELAALRPRDVSNELRDKLAQRLAAPSLLRTKKKSRIALIGALAAALLLAIGLFWKPQLRSDLDTNAAANDWTPILLNYGAPTLLAYSRVLAESPDEMESLLSKHAQASLKTQSNEKPLSAFNHTWNGER